jgi:hypothetical protein
MHSMNGINTPPEIHKHPREKQKADNSKSLLFSCFSLQFYYTQNTLSSPFLYDGLRKSKHY